MRDAALDDLPEPWMKGAMGSAWLLYNLVSGASDARTTIGQLSDGMSWDAVRSTVAATAGAVMVPAPSEEAVEDGLRAVDVEPELLRLSFPIWTSAGATDLRLVISSRSDASGTAQLIESVEGALEQVERQVVVRPPSDPDDVRIHRSEFVGSSSYIRYGQLIAGVERLPPGVGGAAPLITSLSNTVVGECLARLIDIEKRAPRGQRVF